MAFRKRQYEADFDPENEQKAYQKQSSRTTDGRFVYGQDGNTVRKNANKKHPDFYKVYDRRQKPRQIKSFNGRKITPQFGGRVSGKTQACFNSGQKLKFIKEYESMNVPVAMFCKWYGIDPRTFRLWLNRYKNEGEQGLLDKRAMFKGRQPVDLPADIQKDILILKTEDPGIGTHKIADWLYRNRFIRIGVHKVMKVLKGNQTTASLIQKGRKLMRGNSGKEPQHFERSSPGDMYQMDIMTFMLQGLYRVYVIGCIDDFSRFIVGIGLFRRQTTDRCLDVLKSAIEKFGMPKEVLTDNGRQFYTWRGKSEFQKYLVQCGIQHIRSRPYHPQTLGKIESLWRNMYQELLSKEPLHSFEEAEEKIKKWVEWYNFRRPHQGIGGLVPADRFFGVDKPMRDIMEKGAVMVKDSSENPNPGKTARPVYLVGNVDGKEIRIIAKEGSVTVDSGGAKAGETTSQEEEHGIRNTAGEQEYTDTSGQAAQKDSGEGEVQSADGNALGDKETGAGGRGTSGDKDNGMEMENKDGEGGNKSPDV